MKTIIVFSALLAFALAGPVVQHHGSNENVIVLVKEIPSDNIGLDSYKFAYELSDGQTREESAQVEARSNPEESVLRVRGSYSFTDADGQVYTVTYIADENGFQPQGAHLPVSPIA